VALLPAAWTLQQLPSALQTWIPQLQTSCVIRQKIFHNCSLTNPASLLSMSNAQVSVETQNEEWGCDIALASCLSHTSGIVMDEYW
jgi:hypothetical protein